MFHSALLEYDFQVWCKENNIEKKQEEKLRELFMSAFKEQEDVFKNRLYRIGYDD